MRTHRIVLYFACMYSHVFDIASTQVNASLHLKLSSLLQMMQDVATEGAEYIGVGTSVTYPRGLLWVISRMEIDIIETPKYKDRIEIFTYPGKTLGFFYPRHFIIKNQEGRVIMRANSVWALIHKEDRHLEMKNAFPGVDGESHEGELPRPKKLLPVLDGPILEERRIRYSDVDLNGHLNNTKYVEMIEDLLDGKEHAMRILKHVVLNYDREIHENDVITFRGQMGLDALVGGMVGDTPCFEAELKYERWTPNL